MELKSLYFNLVYVFLFSSKTRIYINKTHIHKGEVNSFGSWISSILVTNKWNVYQKKDTNKRCDRLATQVFLFSAKNRIYNKTHTHTQSGAENSLFQFCLTITEPFPSFYLQEMKVLTFSCTVNHLIMRVHKPKVEYKLALQEKPQGSNLDVLL